MAKWISKTIREVVKEIDNKEFVLPVIQRRLVWTFEKMELLFDTLFNRNSFGGIMVIEEDKGSKPLFASRPFIKNGEISSSEIGQKLSNQQYFIIDGQQRLQTFYIGLLGSHEGKKLYFNLYSPQYLRIYDFKFASDIGELPNNSKEEEREIKEYLWYPVQELYTRLTNIQNAREVSKEIIKTKNIQDKILRELIEDNTTTFYETIFSSEVIGVSKIVLNKESDENSSRQRIVEIFRRLNSQGTTLSTADLIASRLKGFDPRMENFLEDTVDKYKGIQLGQDELLKLLFLLQDNGNKEIMDIEYSDAEFALQNEDEIHKALDNTQIFLKETKFLDYYASGNRSFIPLYFICYFLFYNTVNISKETRDLNFNHIKEWLKYSLLYKTFSRGCGWRPDTTGIKRILNIMKNHKGNTLFPKDDLFRAYEEKIHYFSSNTSSDSISFFDLSPIFYILYGKQNFSRDIDHIHPKSRLKEKYEDIKINDIANYQLLDSVSNRHEKNALPFNEWIIAIEQTLKEQGSTIDDYLNKHCIPPDRELWNEDKFENFLKERSKLIYEKIKAY